MSWHKDEDENLPKRWGNYLLLDKVFEGGMGKIYRARALVADPSKGIDQKQIVALKTIKNPDMDPAFKTMFIDEIKTTYELRHENIAKTFSFGEKDGQLYIVMEYVNGYNLCDMLDHLAESNMAIPIPVATYIIAKSCYGLDYAHKFKDKLTGEPKNIIHRDISPHNIILDFEGQVKVIDFGIAKAQSNKDKTETGLVKGKVSYIAPECFVSGISMDHRYDQFALGLTLWELLIGKKTFDAPQDLETLGLIKDCEIDSPSIYNPDIPPELEQILLKSLSKEREERYSDIEIFGRELERFLKSHYPDFEVKTVVDFLEKHFKGAILTNQEKIKTYSSIDLNPYIQDLRKEKSGGIKINKKGDTRKTPIPSKGRKRPGHTKKFRLDDDEETKLDDDLPFLEKHQESLVRISGSAMVLVIGVLGYFNRDKILTAVNQATKHTEEKKIPSQVKTHVRSKVVPKAKPQRKIVMDAKFVQFMNYKKGDKIYINNQALFQGETPEGDFKLKIESKLDRTSFTLIGPGRRPAGKKTPAITIDSPITSQFMLRLKTKKGATHHRSFKIIGDEKEVLVILP